MRSGPSREHPPALQGDASSGGAGQPQVRDPELPPPFDFDRWWATVGKWQGKSKGEMFSDEVKLSKGKSKGKSKGETLSDEAKVGKVTARAKASCSRTRPK